MVTLDKSSLQQFLAPDQIMSDPTELLTYETDAGLERGLPEGVLFPESESDVVRIVAWAHTNGVPLVARGAGTGTSGGAVAQGRGVIIETSRMQRVLEFDEEQKSVLVEPGVVNATLDQAAQARGLFYPPDPASGRVCTLGGNIAENAGGPRCFKYGVTTNYVMELRTVLADGRVMRFGGRALDYPEFDWVGVLTGSEGTMGIITQARLRLRRQPLAMGMLMVAFASVEQAGEAVSDIIAHGLVPVTMEMMDQSIVRIIEDYSHIGLPVDAGALLIIQVDGCAASLPPQIAEIEAVLREHDVQQITRAETAEERERIWRARKDSAGALAWIAPAYYASDCTVPRSQIAVTLHEISRLCQEAAVPVNYLLHAGDGNLHPNYMVADADDREFMERVYAVEKQALQFCVQRGGSITGEHGVGIERRAFMPLMYNADELQAMRDVKAVFDPQEQLNPNKIFPAEISVPAPPAAPGRPPVSPLAPASAEQAAEAIRACLQSEPPLSVRLRGGGTKSGLLPAADIVLSTRHLQGIRACSPADGYVTAGAGTTLEEIQQELARYNMWLPAVSPWNDSTLGGMVSTNFNAPLRMRYGYGGIRDWVLAMTVALPDGRVIRVGRPVVKNVAGYDLPKLLVGAYGTLGLIAEVTCKITTRPRARASAMIPIDDFDRGLTLGGRLQTLCLNASALILCRGCEIGDSTYPCALIYTAEGLAEDVTDELEQVQCVVQAEGAEGVRRDSSSGSEVWAAWLGAASPVETVLRVGVAPRDLPALVRACVAIMPEASFIADFANGLLYVKGALDRSAIGQVRQAALAAQGYALVLTAPPDQGDLDRWGYVPDGLDLMRALKARWDPHGRFNPGSFIV
jgi:D-lactate dehydrogenase (cytochrome)